MRNEKTSTTRKAAVEDQYHELWRCSQEILKRVRPQQTLHLWRSSSLGVDEFFEAVRCIRRNGKVQLVHQPMLEGRPVLAVLGELPSSTGATFYVIQIKEDMPLVEQVLSFLHELVHLVFFEEIRVWTNGEPSQSQVEAWVELLAFQFLETCDYYAFSEFLSFLPPERVRVIRNTP